MLEILWKLLEGVAVLFYGALAIVLAFVFALHYQSPVGAFLAVLTAGATYLFQAVQLELDADDRRAASVVRFLQILPVFLFLASVTTTLWRA